jgi:uncharacterized protein YqhQ
MKFIRYIFCIKNKREVEKEFENHELEVSNSVEPDEIIWDNIVFSYSENSGRRFLSRFVSLIFVIISVILFVYINDMYRYNRIMNPPLLCPNREIDKEEAY